MTSDPYSPDFSYKKYSLEQLDNWMHDVISSDDVTPQEIYDIIKNVVNESRIYHKKQASRAYELLSLLNGHREIDFEPFLKEREYYEGWDVNAGITSLTGPDSKEPIVCASDDSSPECKKLWNDFWEESKKYTDDELDSMCERAATEELKKQCIEQNREYNLREAEYYNKRALLDAQQDRVKRWSLPVQQSGDDYYVEFPDDLLDAANLKEGDLVEWVDLNNGSWQLRKVTRPLQMDEC